MSILKFKTNINCGNCIKAITPHFNKLSAIHSWKVDTENPEKILEVDTDELSAEQLLKTIEKAGFKAESLN